MRVLSTAGDEAKSAALQLSPKQHGEVAECMERLLGEVVERAKRPAAARRSAVQLRIAAQQARTASVRF